MRIAVLVAAQIDFRKELFNAAAALAPAAGQTKCDIFRRSEVGKEREILKKKPYRPLLRRHVASRIGNDISIDENAAGSLTVYAGNHAERRRFPAAGLAEEASHRPRHDRQRYLGNDFPIIEPPG